MTFDRPIFLLVLIFVAAWSAYEWRRTIRHRALIVKVITLVLIVLALAQPRVTVPETRTAVAMLVDTSASISSDDLTTASKYVHDANGARGRNWIRVIPFASQIRGLSDAERRGSKWALRNTSGEAALGTDIEGAVREAVAALPGDAIPRIVLVSDGRENRGSLVRAAWLARELHIPVDAVALPGRPAPTLRLEAVSVPTLAFTGERFPIDIAMSAPRSASGTVELTADGKVIGTSPVHLEPGTTQIRVHTNLNVAGAVEISGRIRAGDLGEVRFERAMTLRRPRILYVSSDPAGTESHLFETLRAGEFDVQQASDLFHSNLSDYQLIVLNNQDFEHIPTQRKTVLEQYVRGGGGLLVIGGEKNIYVENKKTEDALDRVLPAKLAPPRSPEGTCVVLIVDKSSSMEGRKMDLARLSAIGVINNLRPIDQIGVLIFDNSFQWAVPIRKAEDRSTIRRLVSGIMPDGGTQIAPALAEAYRKILAVNATYKHIVLLTDGISEEGDSMALSREAAQQHVTISTVGLGQDVNRAYLEKVAVNAKGKSYFLVDPSGLEQLLVKDVMEHTGSTAVEKAVYATVGKKTSSVVEGVPIESAPALRGYVRFISKPGAETALNVSGDDPLYVSWQFGLGRAAVWSSDAKSRWAEKWVGWSGFDRLWLNIFRDLLPQAEAGEATAHFDETSGSLVVEYRLAPDAAAPRQVPQIYALGPNGFRKPVPVRKTAEGVYRGELRIGNLQGLFRIRPLEDSREFPETGFYREQDELTDYGNDEAVLRHVAAFTGGRFAPQPKAIFDSGGRSLWTSVSLWPALLAIAIALNLIELIMRKWSGLSGFWNRQPS